MEANENDLAMEDDLLNGDGEDELLNGEEYDFDEQDGDQMYSEDKINALLNDQEEQGEDEFQQKEESVSSTNNFKMRPDAEKDHRGHESEDDILELEDHSGHLDFDDEDEGFRRRSEKFAVERAKSENAEEHSEEDPESVSSHRTTTSNKPSQGPNNHEAKADVTKPSVSQKNPQGASQNRPQSASQNRPQSTSRNRPQGVSQSKPQTFSQSKPQTFSQNKPQGVSQKNMQRPNPKGIGSLGKKPQGRFQQQNSSRKLPFERKMHHPNRAGLPNQIAPSSSWDNRPGPGVLQQPPWNQANNLSLANQLMSLLASRAISPNFQNRPAFEAPSQASSVLNFEPPPQEPQRTIDAYVPPASGPAMQPRPPFSSFDVPATMDTKYGLNSNNYNSGPTPDAPRHTYDDDYYFEANDQREKQQQPYFPPLNQDFSVPPPALPSRFNVTQGREPNVSNFVETNNNRQFDKRQIGQNQNFANNCRPQQRQQMQQQLQQRQKQEQQEQQQQQQQQQQQRQPQQQKRRQESSPVNAVKRGNFQGNLKDVDYRMINNPITPSGDVDMRIIPPNFQEASPQPAGHTIDKQGYKGEGLASPQGEPIRGPRSKTSGIDEETSTKLYLQKIEEQKRERQKLLEIKEERRKLRLLKETEKSTEANMPKKKIFHKVNIPVQNVQQPNVVQQRRKVSPVRPKSNIGVREEKNLGNRINVDNSLASQQAAVSHVSPKTVPEPPKPTGFMANRVVSVKNKNYNISAVNSNLKIIKTEAVAPPAPVPTTGLSIGGNTEEHFIDNSSDFFNGRKIIAKPKRGMSSRLVVIDNLSSTTTKQKIITMCEEIGQLTQVAVNRGEARVIFETNEAAQSFVQRYNRRMVDLSLIKARLAPL